jgi:hypothetical protein
LKRTSRFARPLLAGPGETVSCFIVICLSRFVLSDPDWTEVALRVEAATVSQPVLLLVKF